ncbi:helix-turn-helix domain-containing protein [Nocardia sp. 004]|uniref:helix-turn-helix domain-containing protein n=1 Tax=Nocardia sp. 004 TaxID=3385978 RepID=UPI0039A3C2AF
MSGTLRCRNYHNGSVRSPVVDSKPQGYGHIPDATKDAQKGEAVSGGKTNKTATEPPTEGVGPLIQNLRKSRGLTQVQAAELAGVSVSAYSKWEEGTRRPLKENLTKLCNVLGAEKWLVRKMMSLTLPDNPDVRPPKITPEDIGIIDEFLFPALYRTPQYDILYSNQACLDTYPFFAPSPYNSPRPTNVIEILLTDWRSRVIFVDWQDIAHRMVYVLKLWSHGVISERLTQIVETCSQVPEFDHMWHTDPPPSFGNNRISVRRKLALNAEADHYILRSWVPYYLQDDYEILATISADSGSPHIPEKMVSSH